MMEFIESVDGLETVALQRKCPELFNVTDKDGVPNWKLRPAVLETLRIVRISAEQSTTTTKLDLHRHPDRAFVPYNIRYSDE